MTSLVRVARPTAGLVLLALFAPFHALAQPAPGDAEADFEIEIPAEEPAAPAPAPDESEPALAAEGATEADAEGAELAALRARIEQLEARAAAEEQLESEPAPRESAPPQTTPTRQPLAVSTRQRMALAPPGFRVSGYLQVQYENNQISEDQLLQGGTPLNQDRFSVRRGRLRLRGAWEYAAAELEIDASTTTGPTASVRRANLSALWRNPDRELPPYLAVTAGLTEVPFGIELQLGQDELVFMERTTGSLAFFPGPTDVGAVIFGGVGPLRYEVGAFNGTPIDDRQGTLRREPNRAPDFAGRLGIQLPSDVFELVAGVSFLAGTGFHAGQDATAPTLQWIDLNEDGVISGVGELVGVPGSDATPSENFGRWALGADLALGITTGIGATRLYGEITMAENLDRGLYVADPVTADEDVREIAAYVAVVQDVTKWGLVGARYDLYDPNSDLLDQQRGLQVPADASIHTISPVVGVRWPGHGRLVIQYDVIRDHLARNAAGLPTDVRNNRLTVRVQGEF